MFSLLLPLPRIAIVCKMAANAQSASSTFAHQKVVDTFLDASNMADTLVLHMTKIKKLRGVTSDAKRLMEQGAMTVEGMESKLRVAKRKMSENIMAEQLAREEKSRAASLAGSARLCRVARLRPRVRLLCSSWTGTRARTSRWGGARARSFGALRQSRVEDTTWNMLASSFPRSTR